MSSASPARPRMDIEKATRILSDLADDRAYPAMVIDRVLIDLERAHGHAAVNQVIDAWP